MRSTLLIQAALGIVFGAFAGWIDPSIGWTWLAVFLGLWAANFAGFLEGL